MSNFFTNSRVHLIIALLFFPLLYYNVGQEIPKIIIAPLVVYFVFSENSDYFAALLVYFISGSILSFLILFTCFIVVIRNINLYKHLKYVYLLLIFYILITFFFLFYQFFFSDIYNLPFFKIISSISYLFSFYPFFFALKIGKQAREHDLNYLKLIFFCVALIQALSLLENWILYTFFIVPFIFTYLFSFIYRSVKFKLSLFIYLLVLLFLVFVKIKEFTFTLFLSSLFSIFIFYLYNAKKRKIKIYRAVQYGLISSVFFVFYATLNYLSFDQIKDSDEISTLRVSFSDVQTAKDAFLFKAFGDRAPLWGGVFQKYWINGDFLPDLATTKDYSFETSFSTSGDSEIGAHNLFLELLRQYGKLYALSLTGIFCFILLISAKSLGNSNFSENSVILFSSALGSGLIGGTTGQYPVLLGFSFLLYLLLGFCCSKYYNV